MFYFYESVKTIRMASRYVWDLIRKTASTRISARANDLTLLEVPGTICKTFCLRLSVIEHSLFAGPFK